jgi:hypothetical protein
LFSFLFFHEKPEIPSVSPLIQQFLQNLNIWQDSLRRTLETFNIPSDNYLPLSGVNSIDEQTTGLPIHRYRTILDSNNTPFMYDNSFFVSLLIFCIFIENQHQHYQLNVFGNI